MPDFELTSPAFNDGEQIPVKHTADGEGSSPPLRWGSVPEGTRTLALIVHDPDAPSGDFIHWLAWNIDPGPGELGEGVPAPGEGTHGFGGVGYSGPAPPPGHGSHRYIHHLYALDTELELEQGAGQEQLKDALDGHVLAEARLMGTYERSD
jgi:Raf kinase inhibitor-like YbhB/YbcL family protein